MKLEEPLLFETKIKRTIHSVSFGPLRPENDAKSKPPLPNGPWKTWIRLLEKNSKCKLYIGRLEQMIDQGHAKLEFQLKKQRKEPFATISHNDLWTNNTMQIFIMNKIQKNKFLDFQIYTYNSPAMDLLFFIWTSVELSVINERFDDLLKYYYTNFVEVLDELGCDTTSFSWEQFQGELKETAEEVVFRCFWIFFAIFGKKGCFALDLLLEPGKMTFSEENITEHMEERAASMIQFFGSRGWI